MPRRAQGRNADLEFKEFAWTAATAGNERFLEIVQRYRTVAGKTPELSFWTLVSSEAEPSLAAALALAMKPDRYSALLMAGSAEAVLFHLRDGERLLVFQIPSGHEGVIHLVSDSPQTDSAWRVVQRAVRHSFVDLSPVQLDQAHVLEIAEGLRSLGDVEVSRMTARYRDDGSSITRGWKRTGGILRPTPAEAVAELGKRGAVRTLTIQVEDKLSIHLRREAGATLYSGSILQFRHLVLERLAERAAERRGLLNGRVRRPQQPVQPVTVNFDVPLFAEVQSLGAVIEALEAVKGVGVAVLHRNPYLHLVATSYEDGSAFDVLVTNPDELAIYPGFRASMSAFSTVIQQLVDVFGATGVGQEAQREAPTLASLFG